MNSSRITTSSGGNECACTPSRPHGGRANGGGAGCCTGRRTHGEPAGRRHGGAAAPEGDAPRCTRIAGGGQERPPASRRAARRGARALVSERDLGAALDPPHASDAEASTRYLDEVGRRPGLPAEVERALVAAAQGGDAVARSRLVEAFLPVIASVAGVYRSSPSVDRVELVQEGVVGFLRALERYDPSRETPFWAYAAWWVRQAMQQLVAELTGPVVLSDRALRQLSRIKNAHRSAMLETGRAPGRDDLAMRTGLTAEQVDDLTAVQHVPRSIEEPVATEDGSVGTFGELLADPLAEGEYERVLEAGGGGGPLAPRGA